MVLASLLSLVFAGCAFLSNEPSPAEKMAKLTGDARMAADNCVQLCRQSREQGKNLADGPCLSDKVAEDWVCDVAHSPRAEVDGYKANQCFEYGKTANHFVEVSENCEFITAR